MALRGARILSSCNEASNKQEQNMSVNIQVEDKTPPPQFQSPTIQQIIQQPLSSVPQSIQQTIGQSEGYGMPRLEEARQLSQHAFVPSEGQGVAPSIQQTITQPRGLSPQPVGLGTPVTPSATQPQPQPVYVQPVNFTTPGQQLPTTSTTAATTATNSAIHPQIIERGSLTPPPETLMYPSIVPQMPTNTTTGVSSRDFNLEKDLQIQDLETKNKFLNLMLTVYQNNPLFINSYLVCESKVLMNMIKLLTGCEKVDLVINDDIACGGCTANSKLIYISKILITKDGKTEEFKYAFNDIYSKFISYGISLKVVV